MAMHTYIHTCVRIHFYSFVCVLLTYEAGTILTSKVVKLHTCELMCMYVCAYGMHASK